MVIAHLGNVPFNFSNCHVGFINPVLNGFRLICAAPDGPPDGMILNYAIINSSGGSTGGDGGGSSGGGGTTGTAVTAAGVIGGDGSTLFTVDENFFSTRTAVGFYLIEVDERLECRFRADGQQAAIGPRLAT